MVTYPKDWDNLILGDLGKIKMCRRIFSHQTVKSGQIPFYKIGTFGKKADAYITRDLYENYRSLYSYPCKGNILISAAGTIGRTVVYDGKDAYFQDSNIVWLDTSDDEIDGAFLKYFYESYPWQNLEGTTISRLYNSLIMSTPISLPPLPEQKTIAETLSCIDEHIANLTELIEKKKGIRDGALEDLVSGRTRLKGFNGKWDTMPLGKFTAVNPRSDIPDLFYYIDLESVKGISIVGKRRENKHSAPSRARRFAQKGDVFYQTVRPYQKNNYLFNLDGDYVFSTGYAQLRTENDPNFLFLLIRQDSFVNCVLDNCTGTSYPAINPKKLSEIEVCVPLDVEEQRAISQLIMVMDNEIAVLEEEKDKMLQIKAGAMDDLLTGRVRLTRQGG